MVASCVQLIIPLLSLMHSTSHCVFECQCLRLCIVGGSKNTFPVESLLRFSLVAWRPNRGMGPRVPRPCFLLLRMRPLMQSKFTFYLAQFRACFQSQNLDCLSEILGYALFRTTNHANSMLCRFEANIIVDLWDWAYGIPTGTKLHA